MYSPVRARPISTSSSSSGRTNGFIAWCTSPRLSMTSDNNGVLRVRNRARSIAPMVCLPGSRHQSEYHHRVALPVTEDSAASGRDGDVLHTVELVGDRRRIHAGAAVEHPKPLAGLRM